MTAPERDGSLVTYGGPFRDYAPQVDPTTDPSSTGFNQMLDSVAQMTNMATRAWARFTPAGTGTPVLAASGAQHWALWGNSPAVAPTPSRSNVGLYVLTWPSTVSDNIPSGQQGFFGPHTVNFLAADGQAESQTFYHVQCLATGNSVTVQILNTSGSGVDPSGVTFFIKAY